VDEQEEAEEGAQKEDGDKMADVEDIVDELQESVEKS